MTASAADPRRDPSHLAINTIRALAMDAVQKANAGHPGTAMALAPVAYLLYGELMRHNPANPAWPNRDRFVLSAGHACVLQYSALHLSGYDVSLEDLQQFRQWGSRTPGHPEWGHTAGVETTTGPLGQGFANGVGMAIAQRFLAERYNRPHYAVLDHRIYAICSDGDLMEGVVSEAASVAGHLGLGALVYVYDDNRITIDGSTAVSFSTEDKGARFEAYGWHVQHVDDSEDLDAVRAALVAGAEETSRPSLIVLRTHIGYPAPHAVDTSKAHGAPLGESEVRLAKEAMGFDPDKHFAVPAAVREHMRGVGERGAAAESDWQAKFDAWAAAFPEGASDWELDRRGEPREGWREALPVFAAGEEVATRDAGKKIMQALKPYTPTLIGGAADLVESTKTEFEGAGLFSATHAGRNIAFGIREHAMGSIVNGIALRSGDAEALRLDLPDLLRLHAPGGAAVGADGARELVGMDARLGRRRRGRPDAPAGRAPHGAAGDPESLVRPARRRERGVDGMAARARAEAGAGRARADAAEAARLRSLRGWSRRGHVAWRLRALAERRGGSRRDRARDRVRARDRSRRGTVDLERSRGAGRLDALLGALRGAVAGLSDEVLPPDVRARVSVEAGITFGWERWVGGHGVSIGVDRFGASAPYGRIYEELGLTPDRVAAEAEALLDRVG